MEQEHQSIVVVGLGKSGHGLIAYLRESGHHVHAYDASTAYQAQYEEEGYAHNIQLHFGENPTGDEPCDLVILSPGIPLSKDFVKRFVSRGIEVIGEVELAARNTNGRFVGITGTNGKTTTTTLVGEIFADAGYDTRVVGNIGNPIISEIGTATEKTIFVAELSSFQLGTAHALHCTSAGIINITPDHLDRHGSMEEYTRCKLKVFDNQTAEDFAVINFEDTLSMEAVSQLGATKVFFSTQHTLDEPYALYLDHDQIICRWGGVEHALLKTGELILRGTHNVENVLCAIALARSLDVSFDSIVATLKRFEGVAHRLESVGTVRGVSYINDSKGTNPDASIKALEAIGQNIVLLAGGYNKNASFDEFVAAFAGRVRHAIILGETKPYLRESFERLGFKNYTEVETMEEAVSCAHEIAESGDTVLLSPACASWGMYRNYEERGEDFKALVRRLG